VNYRNLWYKSHLNKFNLSRIYILADIFFSATLLPVMVIVLRLAVVKIILHYPRFVALAPHGHDADCINGFVLFAASKTLWGLYKMLLKIERERPNQHRVRECKKYFKSHCFTQLADCQQSASFGLRLAFARLEFVFK
jgi:hypothetical protein